MKAGIPFLLNDAWPKTLGLLFLLELTPPVLHAQNREIKFERIGLEQGVSSNAIFCILQDH